LCAGSVRWLARIDPRVYRRRSKRSEDTETRVRLQELSQERRSPIINRVKIDLGHSYPILNRLLYPGLRLVFPSQSDLEAI
jgi:hypothetical protein